jgi:hypothetical protein
MSCPSTSSGVIPTATPTVVQSKPGKLHNVTLNPGSAVSSVIIYDSEDTTTSGRTVLAKLISPANGATISLGGEEAIIANRGILAVVAGTAAEAVVYVSQG